MCNDHEYGRRIESWGVRCEVSLGGKTGSTLSGFRYMGASIYIVQPAATQHQSYQDVRQILNSFEEKDEKISALNKEAFPYFYISFPYNNNNDPQLQWNIYILMLRKSKLKGTLMSEINISKLSHFWPLIMMVFSIFTPSK